MFSRSALRTAFNVRKTPFVQIPSTTSNSITTRLPATNVFQRCNIHQETPLNTSQTNPNPPTPLDAAPRVSTSALNNPEPTESINPKEPVPPTFNTPLKVSKSLLEKLPFLTAQQSHYITAHLHARPYLITAGDHLRLPFLMPNVKPGDVLRFNRASALGSRDFTLKGAPYIDERLFECRVRVLGVDAEPMRIKEKTKRRQRHVKHVRSKHRYTLLRVMDVKVKSVDEVMQMGAQVVEDGGAKVEATA